MTDKPFQAFDDWREASRINLQQGVRPEYAGLTGGLFSIAEPQETDPSPIMIPKEFLSLARTVSCHSDPERWALLYAALWRFKEGEGYLLKLTADPLMQRLLTMEKAVRRDAHKTKAFVRFQSVQDEEGEHFIAWHQSDHDVLPLVAPFFRRRFEVMRWTILSPLRSVTWDGEDLIFHEGVPEAQAPDNEDAMEGLWRAYYRATFNPARIKLKMMRREMPVRYWTTMPETVLIPDMINEAPARVAAMIAHQQEMDARDKIKNRTGKGDENGGR